MKKGKFIIFEGNEGTGKTTHLNFVSSYLNDKNIKNEITREPGGTEFGESLRDILLDNKSQLDPLSEALLFHSARVVNYNNIKNALDNGIYVICDRFHYSTLVYQGIVESNKKVQEMHKLLDPFFSEKISLIFYLCASPKTSSDRINNRENTDKFESQGINYFEKIHHAYEDTFKNNNKVIKIDTSKNKELVQKEITEHLDRIINE
ncbi:MAG: dTMP kinase [Gammaproteobacteria bacterium]|nr:dTMP kinase [Gammaproteobacteria bacterium]|tara:strand:+ start:81 stop:698 length:618 start_codon:yes stop_codon:yes gene_type:complete